VVSLPQTVDELARRIEAFWSVLEGCTSLEDIHAARRFNPALRANLEPYSDEAVLTRLQSMSGGGMQVDAAEDGTVQKHLVEAFAGVALQVNDCNARRRQGGVDGASKDSPVASLSRLRPRAAV
jgi:hypothetical protein